MGQLLDDDVYEQQVPWTVDCKRERQGCCIALDFDTLLRPTVFLPS